MPWRPNSYWKHGSVNTIEVWKNSAQIDQAIADMATQLNTLIAVRQRHDPLMIGIHSGGVWVAERLHRLLGLRSALGVLDISFYRDDFTRIGINPVVKPSRLPDAIDNRHIILVDDVLETGRTVRAALNELFDFGRPDSVVLAILAERSRRELPIEADVVGLRLSQDHDHRIKLSGPEPLTLLMEPGQAETTGDER
jgi:pyrimidine operon attenuation protein/uracil phosphoribosyltransferase